MTDRFSNFNSISYTGDRQELRVTGTKCRLPDTMSVTGEIFISGADISIIMIKIGTDNNDVFLRGFQVINQIHKKNQKKEGGRKFLGRR